MIATKPTDDLMTVEETCVFLKISRATAYRLMKTGLIPASRVGTRTIRISKSEVIERLRLSPVSMS